ncbi:MAG: DMT family transporter [Bacilli bacterium]|nr:DMT family transporter [Bacilli bacterium]
MSIYIHLIIASLFWGLNVIIMKLLLEHIPFLLLASLRVLLSFVCLFIYIRVKDISLERVPLKKVIVIALFGIYLNFLFTFYGMQNVKGVDNALINALSPMVTLLISFLFLHQKMHKKEMIGVIMSILAFLLSIRFQIFSLKLGFYFMLLGMLCYMVSHIVFQKWHIHNSISYTYYQLMIGFIMLFIHTFIIGQLDTSSFDNISMFYWLLFIVISGIGFAYIQIIYMRATEEIGALKTSFFLSFNPIITYIASIFVLDEEIDYIHIISFVFLIISIIIANKKKEVPED